MKTRTEALQTPELQVLFLKTVLELSRYMQGVAYLTQTPRYHNTERGDRVLTERMLWLVHHEMGHLQQLILEMVLYDETEKHVLPKVLRDMLSPTKE
jgi:hypothetical protein